MEARGEMIRRGRMRMHKGRIGAVWFACIKLTTGNGNCKWVVFGYGELLGSNMTHPVIFGGVDVGKVAKRGRNLFWDFAEVRLAEGRCERMSGLNRGLCGGE